MSLCKYSDLFGRPGEGAHAYRLGSVMESDGSGTKIDPGIAAVDLLATAGVAWAISYYAEWSFLIVLLILLIVGVAMHELFCVNTRANAAIFGRPFKYGA